MPKNFHFLAGRKEKKSRLFPADEKHHDQQRKIRKTQNKIRYGLIFFLLLSLGLGALPKAMATEVPKTYSVDVGPSYELVIVEFSPPEEKPGEIAYNVTRPSLTVKKRTISTDKGGEPLFCVEPYVTSHDEDRVALYPLAEKILEISAIKNKNFDRLPSEVEELLFRDSYYGYGSYDPSVIDDGSFLGTQMKVWQALGFHVEPRHLQKHLDRIDEAIEARKKGVSFAGESIQIKPGTSVDLVDSNKALQNLMYPAGYRANKTFDIAPGLHGVWDGKNQIHVRADIDFNGSGTLTVEEQGYDPPRIAMAGNSQKKITAGRHRDPYRFEVQFGQKETVTVKKIANQIDHWSQEKAVTGEVINTPVWEKKPVSGVTFRLVQQIPQEQAQTQTGVVLEETTDADGMARFEQLPPGSYQLTEVAVPFGFQLNDEPRTITVGGGQTPGIIEVENAAESFLAVIPKRIVNPQGAQKAIAQGTPLFKVRTTVPITGASETLPAGSLIAVSSLENGQLVEQAGRQDWLGEIRFEIPCEATYQVEEVNVLPGFLTPEPQSFSFTRDRSQLNGQTLLRTFWPEGELVNTRRLVPLEIKKIGIDRGNVQKPLEKVSFDLLMENEDQWIKVCQLVTDTEGMARYDSLIEGKYKLIETSTVSGYLLSSDPILFTVQGDTTKISQIVTNFVAPEAPPSEPTSPLRFNPNIGAYRPPTQTSKPSISPLALKPASYPTLPKTGEFPLQSIAVIPVGLALLLLVLKKHIKL